jgi:uncharacterized protein (TIGR03084 family)
LSQPPFSQPRDFFAESEALYALLAARPEADLALVTQFKAWTLEDVIAHLHLFNLAADLSLRDPAQMRELFAELGRLREAGRTLVETTRERLAPLRGRELLAHWRRDCAEIARNFERADPRARLPWGGPDMSARSSISARLMETWAHGQAVYDRLGVVRADADRIRNVAVLGVNTFAWCFRIRGLEVPERAPQVRLRAPSGASWEWNLESDSGLVEGAATEFCQVVAQTRAWADTRLRAEGEVARRWMSIAQCFAGPPEEPPKPGTRYCVRENQPGGG